MVRFECKPFDIFLLVSDLHVDIPGLVDLLLLAWISLYMYVSCDYCRSFVFVQHFHVPNAE